MRMTFYLDCSATTDSKPEMLSGVETGNIIPHDEWNLRGIGHAHTHTEKTTFYAKTTNGNIYMKGLAQC